MNILDENILNDQRQLLRMQRITSRQIGDDAGRKGVQDEEIIPLLHSSDSPTFFTRDNDFYHRHLCHPRYCLVYLDVGRYEVAGFIRRLLCHREFDTKTKRIGKVIRVSHGGLAVWYLHAEKESRFD
ncbi:MAG: hypothetical protein DRI57_12980 [Deltaproteobacteria bacterium]|nr:MAG: hypothetical protein DRI57_12980 [Deltaproteobacteria bacterium]